MTDQTKTLPPLPKLPEKSFLGDDASYGYDAEDMHNYATAYAESAVREALAAQPAPAGLMDAVMLDLIEATKQTVVPYFTCTAIGRGFTRFDGWNFNDEGPLYPTVREAIRAALTQEGGSTK